MCPWHGACFSVTTGDIEDAPSLDSLQSYQVYVKDRNVFIKADESLIKVTKRVPVCKKGSSSSDKTTVILGGKNF